MVVIDIQGTTSPCDTVLIYGHLDKQPHFTGWNEGLSPCDPVIKDNIMYGRGTVDDGYSVFCAISMIKALQELNMPHPHMVITIEGDEESDSKDLMYQYEQIKDKLQNVAIVIALDSGGGDYKRLWLTSSLRGVLECDLNIKIIKEGVHSGDASGIVPDTFRILRILLDRIENVNTGEAHEDLQVTIPGDKYMQTFELT
eukprot:CAMPEP_0114583872 /NCGR_PEP_ID=MMETSP0125-20121206/7551_1 /TAXON_ID=485358 ORGANISM="Aristerostoma sp., Strain ATCC 50986" /NCGR_SAMPLE_ID=MMETSP0125 /ASSEMBLY_ACC=CAM_ASM_000245 /LENGTH=198 /DNA_ID=CAMNT_0001777655 /DNA_START=207 /DNA_END=799 /DNA_ORIENTATION=-